MVLTKSVFVCDFGPFKDFNKNLSSLVNCYMTHAAFLMMKSCSLGQVGLWKQVMFGVLGIRWVKICISELALVFAV